MNPTIYDGGHGVLCDSLSFTWQQTRDVLGAQPGPAKWSGPRIQPDSREVTKGHDWCLVELIDRVQILADNTRTVRALQVECTDIQIGRGRVVDSPYLPQANCALAPGRAPPIVGGNNLAARNRVTAWRSTAATCGASSFAFETFNADPPIYVLDNYRAYLCEGRPSVQRKPDYCFLSALAELDVPLTFAGYGQFLTPVPDYATGLTIDVPLDASAVLVGIAWVDVFGSRYPASALLAGNAPIVTRGVKLAVPSWASAFHLFGPAAALTAPIECTWELTL